MFQEYLFQDGILTVGMLLILALGAWYDTNGAEVPDSVTIPYTLCGITMGVLHDRLASTAACAFMLVFVVCSWRPKWLIKFNAWMLRRTYTEESLKAEKEELDTKAELFEAKHGCGIKSAMKAIEVVVLFGLGLACSAQGWTRQAVVAVSALAVFMICLWSIQYRTEAVAKQGEPEAEEAISAFGGADAIVLIGMLGYYGCIPFLYCLVASLLVYIIIAFLRNIVRKGQSTGGMPMLPALFLAYPIRLYLATQVCPQVVQAMKWAVENVASL